MSASKQAILAIAGLAAFGCANAQTVDQLTEWSRSKLCKDITKDFAPNVCPGVASSAAHSAAAAVPVAQPVPPQPPAPVLRGINGGSGTKLTAMIAEGGDPAPYAVGQTTSGGWKVVGVNGNVVTVSRGNVRKSLEYQDTLGAYMPVPPAASAAQLPLAKAVGNDPTPSAPGTLMNR
ncbi:hypothetical protein [Cupriavidus campinensis]|uniref:Type IV pilus biogenesis protein PilP n=1 Tax=Cupriavidus campinensis TaxID=151783 RepID=A0ABY3EJ86_9BURK|nr:hypothetical protein [Cupriavidus campinensis]TSP11004.1 hypothetical protein FGG12_19260 [Cupriavidus campinensis]